MIRSAHGNRVLHGPVFEGQARPGQARPGQASEVKGQTSHHDPVQNRGRQATAQSGKTLKEKPHIIRGSRSSLIRALSCSEGLVRGI